MKDTGRLNPEKWVERYGDMLFRFALQRINDIAAAEDLVQEALLAAINAKDRFQGQSSERTWLFAILKHKIIDYYRNKKIRAVDVEIEAVAESNFFNENETWKIQPRRWDSNPHDAYEQKQFLDVFYLCISKMPRRLADAFIFREIDGLDTEEICKKLNITATNCGVMLYRARMSLRSCIEKEHLSK